MMTLAQVARTQEAAEKRHGTAKPLVALVLAGALAAGLVGSTALSSLAHQPAQTHAVMTAELVHADFFHI